MNHFTKSQTKKNIILAASQILVSGVTLFVLYKYLVTVLGVELIGVWSIVMAFSAFLRTGDFGFAGSIVKFVSSSMVLNEHEKIIKIINTAFISVAVILAVLLLIFYPLIYFSLPFFIEQKYIVLAYDILPYSIVSVWLAVLGTLTIFVFDGLNRVDKRSICLVAFNLILVILSITFVHFYGFIGLGYAQVIQAFFQLLIAWMLIRKELKISQFVLYKWDKGVFKEMFSYSIHLQVSSLMAMMLEPISKLLLGHFGTMSSVGYFEMANRLVMQVRNIIVNANQALVPMLSKAHTKSENLINKYFVTLKVLFVISLIAYSILATFTSFISEIWIGTYQKEFVYFTYMIIVALGINTLAGAAYFTNMSTGDVKYNTQSQMIIAILNLLLSLIFGYIYGSIGIVSSYASSIIFGSVWLMINFKKHHKI